MPRIFELEQILGCDWAPDHKSVTIQFKPTKGANFGLRLPAAHVDFLLTFLSSITYERSLLDPKAGQMTGELAAIVPEIVKSVRGGTLDFHQQQYHGLSVELESGMRRFLAFDHERFEELKRQMVAAESAGTPPTAH